jgi:outer membrane protein
MRATKMVIVVAAVCLALAAGPAWAQQQPPGAKPAPPAAQETAKPEPPRPFPEGAKVAYVNINAIAAGSEEGKAATDRIQEFIKKKNAELQEQQKALQALQTKLQQGVSVMSDSARQSLEKDITRQSRDLQIAQEDAQTEQQQLTQQLQNEFQQKLFPIIDAIAKEKGLHMVFSVADSGAIWADTGLDLSSEVIKRFDAASKTPAKK